ncbi:hypothetical protein fugu_007858 [Takifugu bimaculatus]|uniref:SRCR domain-containing protein n=1 Tax=Takifugu bimaculatus TaxID=433685 RepID=A0A4Z2B053_9TELE|nr:hypothetical protein fugu_007858 [Takifugu bimaculatus]
MDVQAVLSMAAVFLITAGSQQIGLRPAGAMVNGTGNSSDPTPATSIHRNCNCAVLASSPTPSSSLLQLGLLKVAWTSECKGDVQLYQHSLSSLAVCHGSQMKIDSIFKTVCQKRRNCKGAPRWSNGKNTENGVNLTDNGIKPVLSCEALTVQCTVAAEGADGDIKGQLRIFKVMTALLCCALLLLLMVRFTRPTVKALQKRLSDRRQNRWIGPTQSHSVSYHREQTAVKNNDKEKRLSYPALERLMVTDSREPSSNRNSDCNY